MKTLEIKLSTRTLNKDQFDQFVIEKKKGWKHTTGKQLFRKPKPYRILTPRTVRLARGEQHFDRYKSHSRPLRASLPRRGLKREMQTFGRLAP